MIPDHKPLLRRLRSRVARGLAAHCFYYELWRRILDERRLAPDRARPWPLLAEVTRAYRNALDGVPSVRAAILSVVKGSPGAPAFCAALARETTRVAHEARQLIRRDPLCPPALHDIERLMRGRDAMRLRSPYCFFEVAVPMRACACPRCG